MTSRAFRVVEMFEEAVAEYASAPYGVAVESCSMALQLALRWERRYLPKIAISVPFRTYVSVPMAITMADFDIQWVDADWTGAYRLEPLPIIDSALRFRRGMYEPGTLYCVSFHARKRLNIGRGGMILTNDGDAVEWLRRARFDGRTGSIPFMEDSVSELGWNAYMTPEQAARGLQLLESLPDDPPDIVNPYPDLRTHTLFAPEEVVAWNR